MRLRSGKRKKSSVSRKVIKTGRNDSFHCHPQNSDFSSLHLNSSESLNSFNMESGEAPIEQMIGSNNELSSIWSNSNSNPVTIENHIRNIIGAPIIQEDRRSLPYFFGWGSY
ncbi:hypothetical protein ACFFRR_009819 [Megaselia abdita]